MFSKKKILLAEDDPAISTALTDTLGRAGYKVQRVIAGSSIVSEIQLFKPDILLLDILLPVKSGTTVLDILRGKEMNFQKPIIVLTNLPEDESLHDKLKSYNATYLNKSSTSLVEVLSKIEKALDSNM